MGKKLQFMKLLKLILEVKLQMKKYKGTKMVAKRIYIDMLPKMSPLKKYRNKMILQT